MVGVLVVGGIDVSGQYPEIYGGQLWSVGEGVFVIVGVTVFVACGGTGAELHILLPHCKRFFRMVRPVPARKAQAPNSFQLLKHRKPLGLLEGGRIRMLSFDTSG